MTTLDINTGGIEASISQLMATLRSNTASLGLSKQEIQLLELILKKLKSIIEDGIQKHELRDLIDLLGSLGDLLEEGPLKNNITKIITKLTEIMTNMNPETHIQYALPEDIHVELIIYNVLGRQVAELVNTYQQAGYHRVIWNGNDNASGLYFVAMSAGDCISTQKLILVK